jgi:intracellular sulfur oxidation DsrE/DsrF family protein
MSAPRFSRRGLLPRLLAATAAGAATFRAAAAEGDGLPRVVYHVSDAEKVAFALGNIANHIEGMGGPDKVRIALVVNGPALLALRQSSANPDLTRRAARTAEAGVWLGACGNTLDAQKLTVADLLPGFVRIEEGGVTRLHVLQMAGYAYIRP